MRQRRKGRKLAREFYDRRTSAMDPHSILYFIGHGRSCINNTPNQSEVFAIIRLDACRRRLKARPQRGGYRRARAISPETVSDWTSQLGRSIRTVRETRGLTQEALAYLTHLDLETIGGMEAGRGTVQPFLKVIDVLKCRFVGQRNHTTLDDWIQHLQNRAKATQVALCALLGLSKPTLNQIKKGRGNLKSLAKLMTSFGAKPKLRPIEEFTGPDFIKARGTTPLRYVGGKSQMLRLLGYHMPARIDEFRELFCGGASMAFLIAARYPGASIWINDLDEPLFRFWKSLQDPETSHEMIERLVEIRSKYVDTADLRKLFFEKQEMLRHGHGAAVDRAVALYFLSRCSFNGLNNSGSFSAYNAQKRFRMEHIHRLEEWTPRMAGWEITNLDYREVLKKPWTGESPFLFCDPPYDNKARLYGDRGDKHIEFDHQAFHRAVQATPRNVAVMVTYNAADKIRVEYDDWQQIGFDIEYSLRSDEQYRKNQKSRRDLLLLRY